MTETSGEKNCNSASKHLRARGYCIQRQRGNGIRIDNRSSRRQDGKYTLRIY